MTLTHDFQMNCISVAKSITDLIYLKLISQHECNILRYITYCGYGQLSSFKIYCFQIREFYLFYLPGFELYYPNGVFPKQNVKILIVRAAKNRSNTNLDLKN